jgi:hypothetical protein
MGVDCDSEESCRAISHSYSLYMHIRVSWVVRQHVGQSWVLREESKEPEVTIHLFTEESKWLMPFAATFTVRAPSSQMLFFDDWDRNVKDVAALGVTAVSTLHSC